MTEILENLPTYAGIAIATYSALLFGAQVLQDLASEKITSQKQLDTIVDEEAIGYDVLTKSKVTR